MDIDVSPIPGSDDSTCGRVTMPSRMSGMAMERTASHAAAARVKSTAPRRSSGGNRIAPASRPRGALVAGVFIVARTSRK